MLVLFSLRLAAEEKLRHLAGSVCIGVAVYLLVQQSPAFEAFPPGAFAAFLALAGLLSGAPLAHVLLACAYLAVPFGATMPEPAIVATATSAMSKFLLLAIPFFLLAGTLFSASDLARQLIHFAGTMVGHLRGGLGQTALLASVLFSGASGSSIANAALMSTTMAPALVANGYAPARAGALVAAAAVLDNIIPPSIAFLILAAATNLSVGALLVGGFVAGTVLSLALALAIHITAERGQSSQRATAHERLHAAKGALWAIGLGVVVVAGIRLGVVTTTEAGALAAAYTLVVCMKARMTLTALFGAFREAAVAAAAIGFLIGAAAPLAFLIAVDGVATKAADIIQAQGMGAAGVMLLANLVLLVAGLFLDTGAAILLLAPVLLPIAVASGIDPIHFGVIIIVNLMIGGLTPPVGMLAYVVGSTMRVPVSAIFRAVTPFLFALLVALALLSTGAVIATF